MSIRTQSHFSSISVTAPGTATVLLRSLLVTESVIARPRHARTRPTPRRYARVMHLGSGRGNSTNEIYIAKLTRNATQFGDRRETRGGFKPAVPAVFCGSGARNFVA